jgi:hypothetical protein
MLTAVKGLRMFIGREITRKKVEVSAAMQVPVRGAVSRYGASSCLSPQTATTLKKHFRF